ncbi:MAG TPA: hypothetical protein VHE35_33065 [Kofleriaceae bacterium]|nr:hypothetical protein [Kofleriaceae bacterium]
MRSSSFLVPLFLLAAACGGDDGGADVAPAIIPGGGIHDPGIDGVVNVFVTDSDTDQPIANATVRVGATDGTTDTTGLVIVKDVTGPQTVLVRAAGYAASMWVGVDGANVTVPLDRTPTPDTPPPQAQLTGSITGWDGLAAPAAGHVRAALVTFAQDPELGSTANDITQPPAMNNIPAAACVRLPGPGSPPCAWKLNARAGTIALGMIVIDIDGHGTPNDDTDDTQTITGYSVKQPITVVAGANQSGIMMDLPPANSTVTASIDFGTPPAALGDAAAVVGLDLGANGILRLTNVDRMRSSAVLPNLTAFGGATYELLGVAQEPVDDGTAAQSIVLRHGISSPSSLAAGDWLAPPTGLASDRQTASFTRGAADGPYIVEFDSSSGQGAANRVLGVGIFDDSSQVSLPTDFAPLPSGPVTMKVTTLDTGSPIDVRDFEIDDLTQHAVRAASDVIELN